MAIYYRSGNTNNSDTGRIIQVLETVKTDTFTESVGQGNHSAALCSTSITLHDSSNKVLCMAQVSASLNTSHGRQATLFRGSTPLLIGDASDSRSRRGAGSPAGNTSSHSVIYLQFVDTPGSVGAHSYNFKVSHNENSTLTVKINHTDYDQNTSAVGRTASSLILMEIAG